MSVAAKTLPALPGKIYDRKTLNLLFGTCWITDFISYLGRLNYAASMVEIGADMGYSTSMLGLIATIMFICYGAGQLVGGALHQAGKHRLRDVLTEIMVAVKRVIRQWQSLLYALNFASTTLASLDSTAT